MINLTTQERIAVFSLYIGCECFAINDVRIGVLEGINVADQVCAVAYGDLESYKQEIVNVNDLQLCLLSPLEIKDDHTKCLIKFMHGNRNVRHIVKGVGGFEFEQKLTYQYHKKTIIYSSLRFSDYLYLVRLGYDMPFFFGFNNPANMLTPIELQIAIKKNF